MHLIQQGNNYGQFRGRSHGCGRGNYHGCSCGMSNYRGNNNYQYHQKLDYIYQHFQDNKKIYESDPELARYENDNTLYPHINNDIEYGLFEDVISSYYLDSQIKDDFKCDQECYTDTQEKQQDQPLTPYTHTYDHITQPINNLEDSIQQNTLYTQEEDASLFTSDTTIA